MAKGRNKKNSRIAGLVDLAIKGIEEKLGNTGDPLTIGDYLKLMQLQKEVEQETPKEIKVTWVEPPATKEPEG
jgi:hypothetical protein